MQQRAYSTFELKSINEEQRVIVGMASTPSPDRGGDEMDPKGAQFMLPLPFKWQHKEAVGEVFAATVTPAGIEISARVATITEPGLLKDLVDFAWQSIKHKLARGLSIGWSPIEATRNKRGGLTVSKWDWFETSAVVIPMNAAATIHTIKSFDTEPVAVTGASRPGVLLNTPGATGLRHGSSMKSYSEQITANENTRAALVGERDGIQAKASDEGRTKDDTERSQFDELTTKIQSIDAELKDLRELDQTNRQKAQPVIATTPQNGSESRGGGVPVQITSNLPKGTAFTRFVQATVCGRGDYYRTLEHAKQWHDTTPEVELMVKAAVAAGSTTDATWAGPLVLVTPISEFLELLRPRTLLGRIPGLRQVPFNVSVPTQTAGGTYNWVGQRVPKPVTKADYSTITVPFAKAAGIIVISEELARLSTPSAESLIREEMIAGIAQFLDGQFVDPAVAAVANVSPASITNGASTAAASGVTSAAAKADLAASVAVFTAAGIPLEGSVWLMNDSNAFGLGLSVNALGQPLFPGMGLQGGSIMGIPVVVSNTVSNRVILVHAPSILFADEGGTRIDVSREASVQMDSAPDNPLTATTVMVSLWQANLIGLRVERWITWIRARTAAVRYISAAAYVGS